jgi:hypothetical protein
VQTSSYNGWLVYKASARKVDAGVTVPVNDSMPLAFFVGGEHAEFRLTYVGTWQNRMEEQRVLLREVCTRNSTRSLVIVLIVLE